MDDDAAVDALVSWVRTQPCVIEPGLTDDEVRRAETEHGIRFPALWRAVLQHVHPVALPMPPRRPDGVLDWTRWPDWRLRDPDLTRVLLEGPVGGVLFDVEHGFWWHDWGPRPGPMTDRLTLARQRLAEVPQLVPVCRHWYVGQSDDSPVFSVMQTDLWIPAVSIAGLATGRSEESLPLSAYPIGTIPFWSRLHAWSQIGHRSRDRFLGRRGSGRRVTERGPHVRPHDRPPADDLEVSPGRVTQDSNENNRRPVRNGTAGPR